MRCRLIEGGSRAFYAGTSRFTSGGERAGGGRTVVGRTVVGFQVSEQHRDRIANSVGRSRVPAPLQKSFTLLGFRTDSHEGSSPRLNGVRRPVRGLRLRRLAADYSPRNLDKVI